MRDRDAWLAGVTAPGCRRRYRLPGATLGIRPNESCTSRMSTARRVLLLLLLVVVLGGVIFLATWDRPPPVQQIEVDIPDGQLPR